MILYIFGYFISFTIILSLWLYVRRAYLDDTDRFFFSFMSACIAVVWPISLPLTLVAVGVNCFFITNDRNNSNV